MTGTGERWYDHAACVGKAPLFDAESDGPYEGRNSDAKRRANAHRYEAAARVCAVCPVTAQCWRDARPGRDEGIRAGRLLPPLFERRRTGAA